MVAVLSDKPELREQFCKSNGTEVANGEMTFYNATLGNKTSSLIEPTAYPDKIQPLLYSLSIADYAILIVDVLTPKIGELIVALDSLQIENGIIVSNVQLPVKGTVLEKYETVADMTIAKEKLNAGNLMSGTGNNAFALVDKTNAVPSIGNVAHTFIKVGKIKKHDKLLVLPEKKEIEIRSIRINGNEVEEANAGTRCEVAYRGDLFERGLLVPLRNEYQVENIVNGRFKRSPFFKDEIKGRVHAYTNMQFLEGTVTENDFTLLNPLAFEKGETILVVDASNQKLRIAGVFQSKW